MENIGKEKLQEFEEIISSHYEQTKIRAPVHLSKGNEDQIISIFQDIQEEDWVFSNWRNHYHALLKGIPPEDLERDILAGKSMHISSKKHKFYSSSLVAGSLPIALGTAMALKMKNYSNHVWAFCGDMASETGVFHEVTKYALGHDLPITFIVEDDGLSVYTPTKEVWRASTFFGDKESLLKYGPLQKRGSKSNIRRYSYERQLAHHGVGLWLDFPEDEKSGLESIVKRGLNYEEELKNAMENLAKNESVLFLGQTVAYKGSPMYVSLENVPMERRIELPVMEEVQMGMSIGLSLEGVSIYPRFDFLTLATNQLVNHLDKAHELSYGQFNPKVIVRVKVGDKEPLYPGPQHCQDHTEAYKSMLTNINVVKLEHSDQIVPEYAKAIKRDKSTLLVEV